MNMWSSINLDTLSGTCLRIDLKEVIESKGTGQITMHALMLSVNHLMIPNTETTILDECTSYYVQDGKATAMEVSLYEKMGHHLRR
jgi:hypothetical protein